MGMTREQAERTVRERAQWILKQASDYSMGTLTALESLVRGSAQFRGRKLVFFISDGFYLNDRNTGFADKLRQITDAALRSGIVIYSIDARGGQLGSASQWIEIPDLSKHQLALSSIHLGGRVVGGSEASKDRAAPRVQFSVDRRFARTTRLDFLAFIYNAAQGSGAVDLSAQVQLLFAFF